MLLLTAAWVSVFDLALQYWLFPLRQQLGIYVPLIAANCLLLSTLEGRILREGSGAALAGACRIGAWVILWMVAAGAFRELAATGLVFGDAGLIGFEAPDAADRSGFPVLRSPAGAFLALGLLAALAQAVPTRRAPA
jgi:electron transport complex protein RnfE